ncbi:MAG: MFS transporter [Candidatus Thermoplasmatota archaeon]|nr:MFS transporter [Candidatus Thermoplasmatota archaeon]MCL5665929.1 MFS transporter [Candidatus Thermoplasmatota archaeon]
MFVIVESDVESVARNIKSPYGTYSLLKDKNGRQYRVGESPGDITKRVLGYRISRRVMVLGAWMCFFFGSVLEYGWGSASTLVISHYGWTTVEGFFNYTVYVLFEATVAAYIFSRLREKGLLSLRRMLWLGAALLIISYIFFANAFAAWISYVGYAMIGGLASGLAYAAGGGVISKWFPDKRGWRLGLANGAWAYGAVPFIIIYTDPKLFYAADFQFILYLTGTIIAIGLFIASFLVCDAPKNWWPAEVDPIAVANGRSKSRELKANPPAVAQFTTQEFFATRQGKAQMISFTLALAASLFNVSLYAPFGAAMGFSGGIAFTVGAAGFAFTDGIGRPTQGWISTFIGRRKALTIFYLLMGIGGLGVLAAGLAHQAIIWAILAVLTGAVSGSCFVFDWLIISDYFGENNVATNWSVPYMLKVFGGAFGGIGATTLLVFASGYGWGAVTGTFTGTVTYTDLSWILAFLVATIFALIAAALVWFYEKKPTIEEYIKVREKLGLPIPSSVSQPSRELAESTEASGGGE